ncbi:MAG: hypothetical protein OES34_11485, partial [Nitrosopumilus sp.]|nr:hypothetical protein [Nitrosopumilus sp.]
MVKSFTNVMILVSLILLLGGPSSAQNQTGPVQTVDAVPSGACNTKIVLKVGGEAAAADQGKTYCCTASTWSQCWEVDVSAELAAALADETGSSADSFVVFSDSPTFVGWDDGETVFEWDDGGGHPHEIKMRMDHDCFGGLCPTGGDHYVVLVWEPEYDGDTLLDVSGFAMGDFRGVNAAGGAAILQIRDPTDLYPDLALTGTNVLTDVVTFNRDPNDDLQIRVKGGDIGLLDDNLTTTGTITGEQITSTDDATVTGKLTSGDVTTGGLTSTGNTDIYNFQGNLAKDNSGNFLEWFVGNSRSVLTNYGRWPTAELTCNTGDFALSGDDCTDLFNSTGHFTSDVVDAVGCPVPGPGCAPQLEELVIVVGGNDNGPIHPSDINHTIGKWFWQARFHGSEFYIPDNMKVELQYDNDLVGESACCDSGGTACTWQTAQDVSGYQANGDIESLFQYTLTSDLPNYPAGAVSVCGIRWTWGDWRCTNGGSCNLDKVRLSDMTFGYFMNETHGEYPLTYDPDNRNFMLDAIEWLDDSGTLYGVEFNTTADQFELDAGVVVKNKTNAVENWTIEALNSIGYGNLVIQDTTDSPGGGYVCIGDWDGTANKDCADAGFLGQLNLLSGLGYAELVLADTNMTGRVTFNASSTGDLTITPIGGDLNIPNATLNITGTGSIDLTSNALVDGILDSGVATTTHATDANFLQLLRHATDCTAITDGKDGELCIEEDDDALYSCQETGDGTCNTPGEWISVGGGGFSPTDLATDYGTETITDTWTIQSLFNFDSGTEGTLRLPTSTSLPGTCSIGDTYYDTDGDTDGELY